MDSGNSGSLQSSSGGDDEFDSRPGGVGGVDSSPLSALLRPSPSPSAAAFSLHGSYFGLQELTSAPPPQQQQAGTWSSGSFAGASGLSSSSSPRVAQPDSGAGGRQQAAADTAVAAAQGQGAAMGAPAPTPAAQPPRGSRKRTRASRRAPTTVLTTDTSNFRAMVQEFTGIPSPPFAAGVGVGIGGTASSLRTRFDHIFPPPSSTLRSAADATASLPPYLLRPFPHKLPTVPSSSFPPFSATTTSSSSSSMPSSSNIGVANANATATGTAATAAAPFTNPVVAPTAAAGAGDTFQQLTSSALLRLQQDPSSYLSFQNLLDSSQPSSQSIFGAAGGFGQASRLHDPAPSPSDFLASVGGGSLGGLTHGHGGLLGSEGGLHLHHSRGDVHGHGGDELSGVVAAGASGGSCKLNYSHAGAAATSSSGAASGGDKPPVGGGGAGGAGRPGGRGEGLDPWICTSE